MDVGVNNRASAINQIFVGVNNIARLVYQGGGGSGSFQLPTFTGSSSIFGDETSGRIELYESGTLVLFPGMYDIFAVGGGSSSNSLPETAGGGGSGGYTNTRLSYKITSRSEHNVVVGAGGASGGTMVAGGESSLKIEAQDICSAKGGSIEYTPADGGSRFNGACGLNGGSGGGAGRLPSGSSNGGTDGGNGGRSVTAGSSGTGAFGGTGQGTTTRMFGEAEATLYAGGGGGAGRSSGSTASPGAGGSGGGGTGAAGDSRQMGTSGTANTGGGAGGTNRASNSASGNCAAGGSGIVIVRWSNGGGNYSPTLADNTWSQIAAACDSNDPILDSWNIGDAKDAVVNGETLTFVIVGKNHDDLADGSGKAKLTFGMKELMASTRKMNSSNTNVGSFAGSAMYSWLSGTIDPNLPVDLRDVIKAVDKKTSSGRATSTIRTDEMHLWLFAEIEVFGTVTCSFAGEGAQYQYFTDESKRIKKLSNGAGAASRWWLRSPDELDIDFFCCVLDSGRTSNLYSPTTSMGVCFGFCI